MADFEQELKVLLTVDSSKFIKDLENSLVDKNITITLSRAASKELATLGYDKLMGARPLQRVITEHIKTPLSEEILFGELKNGGNVTINFKQGKFEFLYN